MFEVSGIKAQMRQEGTMCMLPASVAIPASELIMIIQMECVRRNVGHLCTKDERQPRAKRAKTDNGADNNKTKALVVLAVFMYHRSLTLSVMPHQLKRQKQKRLPEHSRSSSTGPLAPMPTLPPFWSRLYPRWHRTIPTPTGLTATTHRSRTKGFA